MRSIFVAAALTCQFGLAQEITVLPPEPNNIIGEYIEAKPNGVRAAASERKIRLLHGATIEDCDLYFDDELCMVRSRKEEKTRG